MNKIIEFKIKKINEDEYNWAFSSFEEKVIKEGFEFEYEREVDSGGIFVTNENTRLEYYVNEGEKYSPTLYLNLKDVDKNFTASKEEVEDIKDILEEINFRYNDFEEFLN
jgi:hypothetical protein